MRDLRNQFVDGARDLAGHLKEKAVEKYKGHQNNKLLDTEGFVDFLAATDEYEHMNTTGESAEDNERLKKLYDAFKLQPIVVADLKNLWRAEAAKKKVTIPEDALNKIDEEIKAEIKVGNIEILTQYQGQIKKFREGEARVAAKQKEIDKLIAYHGSKSDVATKRGSSLNKVWESNYTLEERKGNKESVEHAKGIIEAGAETLTAVKTGFQEIIAELERTYGDSLRETLEENFSELIKFVTSDEAKGLLDKGSKIFKQAQELINLAKDLKANPPAVQTAETQPVEQSPQATGKGKGNNKKRKGKSGAHQASSVAPQEVSIVSQSKALSPDKAQQLRILLEQDGIKNALSRVLMRSPLRHVVEGLAKGVNKNYIKFAGKIIVSCQERIKDLPLGEKLVELASDPDRVIAFLEKSKEIATEINTAVQEITAEEQTLGTGEVKSGSFQKTNFLLETGYQSLQAHLEKLQKLQAADPEALAKAKKAAGVIYAATNFGLEAHNLWLKGKKMVFQFDAWDKGGNYSKIDKAEQQRAAIKQTYQDAREAIFKNFPAAKALVTEIRGAVEKKFSEGVASGRSLQEYLTAADYHDDIWRQEAAEDDEEFDTYRATSPYIEHRKQISHAITEKMKTDIKTALETIKGKQITRTAVKNKIDAIRKATKPTFKGRPEFAAIFHTAIEHLKTDTTLTPAYRGLLQHLY